MPLAWDRTSLSQPAPHVRATASAGHDEGRRRGRLQVPRRPGQEARQLRRRRPCGAWSTARSSSRSFSSDGEATLVPNPNYSGSPKPSISKFVELPFTSEAAIYNQMRSGGPSAITVGNVPAQYAPQTATLASRGLCDQQGRELLVQLLPAELQHQRDHFTRRRAGEVRLQAAVLPRGVPAPDRPAGLDQRVPEQHGDPDVRPDSDRRRRTRSSTPRPSRATRARSTCAAAQQLLTQQRLEGRVRWDDHVREAGIGCR